MDSDEHNKDFLLNCEEGFQFDIVENTNDEPDDCTQDLSDDEEESFDAIHLTNTCSLKNNVVSHNIANKVKARDMQLVHYSTG